MQWKMINHILRCLQKIEKIIPRSNFNHWWDNQSRRSEIKGRSCNHDQGKKTKTANQYNQRIPNKIRKRNNKKTKGLGKGNELNFISKILLNYDIERLEVTIKVQEEQLQNMRSRLYHLKTQKSIDEMKKQWAGKWWQTQNAVAIVILKFHK